MNDRSRMMLYALTAVACVMWIWQSVKESMNDGTIISTSNIIFLVCIGIAAMHHQPLIASNHRYRSPESSESSHFSKGTLWK